MQVERIPLRTPETQISDNTGTQWLVVRQGSGIGNRTGTEAPTSKSAEDDTVTLKGTYLDKAQRESYDEQTQLTELKAKLRPPSLGGKLSCMHGSASDTRGGLGRARYIDSG